MPHNRVRKRDGSPIPEPPLPSHFCKVVTLPSGNVEVKAMDFGIENAYRLSRYPKPTEADVVALTISEEEIRRLYEETSR